MGFADDEKGIFCILGGRSGAFINHRMKKGKSLWSI